MTTRPVSCLYHSFTPCFFSIPFSPFSSRARHAPFFRPRVITNISNVSSLSFTTLVTLANNLIAFLSRSQLFSRLFVPELGLSKNEQFIPVYRFRDRSKNRQINSLPINRLLSNDQLSPVLLFLPPYSTPLSSSNEAETLEPVLLHSHPSIHPFIPEGDRKIEIVIQRVLAG